MKIFFGKYTGEDIERLPSSYLIWLIEECDKTEFTLSIACKKELSQRLKLEWSSPDNLTKNVQNSLLNAQDRMVFLEQLLCMSIVSKGNPVIIEKYYNNKKLLDQHIQLIKLFNE